MLVSLLADTLSNTFCQGPVTTVSFSAPLSAPHSRFSGALLLTGLMVDGLVCGGGGQAVNDGKTHSSTFMFQCKTVPTMTIKQYFQR